MPLRIWPPKGLPPHTRGSLGTSATISSCTGSTPAHAGKPPTCYLTCTIHRVYPRTRGEALAAVQEEFVAPGLPPHTRGSQERALQGQRDRGSTPAHAGKPPSSCPTIPRPTVYPRTRGEAVSSWCRGLGPGGLPPHTRGSQAADSGGRDMPGSTPAHAGKPSAALWPGRCGRVYPRTRGEADVAEMGDKLGVGLPPHTRGSPVAARPQRLFPGSTPAHAGKPRFARSPTSRAAVYPRTRGEAGGRGPALRLALGLPPHTRGSPEVLIPETLQLRSTPAHAGSPGGVDGAEGPGGSTPAHAGKPSGSTRAPRAARVYPRTRGEADASLAGAAKFYGLPPHTRGSPLHPLAGAGSPGSTPAHAGKPQKPKVSPATRTVYPRTRGEASRAARRALTKAGLPPHTRGSPHGLRGSTNLPGSTPAHAGKP